MRLLSYRGSSCACALAFGFALLNACGESSSGSHPAGGSGSGAEAGQPTDDGGASSKGGSSAGSAGRGGTVGTAGSSDAAGAGNETEAGTGGAPGAAGMPSSDGGQPTSAAGAGGEVAGAGGEPNPVLTCTDQDGDGYGTGDGCLGSDCDDANPLVNPGMLELADDSKDNDCQGGDLKAATGPGYYVNGSDGNCSDVPGALGTKAAPYCTIELAVVYAYQTTAADDLTGRSLFVAKGTYPLTVGTPRSVRIYGGYDATDWSYDSAQNVTIIGGADTLQDVDGFAGWTSWLNVNGKARAVVQGFHIQGGKRPGAPIFAVELNTSGRVELYDNVIVAGEGYQTLAVNIVGATKADSTTSDVWLLQNHISAGVPTDSSNYGVNNLGTAVLWGNVIDMGQGSGKPQAFGAAVQNYGNMTLVNNVLNGGDYGSKVDASYGFINATADSVNPTGIGFATHNVIFGGRGGKSSVGVRNDAELSLINNVMGDRTPGPLASAQKPSDWAAPLTHGFAGATQLKNNDFYQLIYSDEVSPPNAAANRHLFAWFDASSHFVESAAGINACNWTGCGAGSDFNISVDPGFVGGGDFHVTAGSALVSAGVNPTLTRAHRGLSNLDIDGQARPAFALGHRRRRAVNHRGFQLRLNCRSSPWRKACQSDAEPLPSGGAFATKRVPLAGPPGGGLRQPLAGGARRVPPHQVGL